MRKQNNLPFGNPYHAHHDLKHAATAHREAQGKPSIALQDCNSLCGVNQLQCSRILVVLVVLSDAKL